MKVLWFTNILMPNACSALGKPVVKGSGWWMVALLERLRLRKDVRLAVATVAGFKDARFTAGGVDYFVIRRTFRSAILARLRHPHAADPVASQTARYAAVVREWNPDLVHVHGTERDYGLIKPLGLVKQPVVVSLQGMMRPYSRQTLGNLLPQEMKGSMSDRLTSFNGDSLYRWKSFRRQALVEEQILRSANLVLGRTEWDHAWAWAIHPNVEYRHVDELMRSQFLHALPWSLHACRRHEVICTTGSVALKGLHVLVEAIWRLRQLYPDVTLHVAASGFTSAPRTDYARFVLGLLRRWSLESTVHFLGWQDAEHLADALRNAHCYVSPSFIENSSNALQEAMLVGTPVVATACGGTSTIVDAGSNGLTFPPGDSALLALQIHRLFRDDSLAIRIGAAAREVARERQDPGRIEAQTMSAYYEALGAASKVTATNG